MKISKNSLVFLFFTLTVFSNLLPDYEVGLKFDYEGDLIKNNKISSQFFCAYKENNNKIEAQLNLSNKKPVNATLELASNIKHVSIQGTIDINRNNITSKLKALPVIKMENATRDNASAILYATMATVIIEATKKELQRKQESRYEDFYDKLCTEKIEKFEQLIKENEQLIKERSFYEL